MNNEELSSDSEDEDYIPKGISASEEDDSGEDESLIYDEEEKLNTNELKRKNKTLNDCKRKRKKFIKHDNNVETNDIKSRSELHDISDSNKTDKLWNDFLKDTATARPSKTKLPDSSFAEEIVNVDNSNEKDSISSPASVVIETSSVIHCNNSIPKNNSQNCLNSITTKQNSSPTLNNHLNKKVGGGLSSVLDKINKKPKINILEKSKLDWQNFTKEEGIQEDLKKHNIGKQGYLERMSFLQRTDQKQFEIERDFRLANRKKS